MTDLVGALVTALSADRARVVVEDGERTVTAGELLDSAGALADTLPEGLARVGVLLPRGTGAITAVLAAWIAGAAPVPLDTALTGVGVSAAAERFDIGLVLTDGQGNAALAATGPTVPRRLVDAPGPAAGHPRAAEPPGDYLVLTSGTTGTPRAVHGSGAALVHYLRWQVEEFALGHADRCAHLTPLWFDFSFKEVWAPLLAGARVCVAPPSALAGGRSLATWLAERGVTVACLLPFRFAGLLAALRRLDPPARAAACATLREVLVSGEALRPDLVTEWQRLVPSGPDLVNLYGPTESTVIKLAYRVPDPYHPSTPVVPLGRPIPGAAVEILPLPDGTAPPGAGEIGIRSRWLANGYHGDEQATRRVFVRDDPSEPPLLRTGDLGRVLPDGTVEYLGRTDRQIKRRGVRLALDDIEAAVAGAPGVGAAAVVAVPGDVPVVVAFCTARPGDTVDERRVLAHARAALGAAAAPDRILALPDLPVTARGKRDYGALSRTAATWVHA